MMLCNCSKATGRGDSLLGLFGAGRGDAVSDVDCMALDLHDMTRGVHSLAIAAASARVTMGRCLIVVATVLSSSALAGNFATCVIEDAKNVQNDMAALAVRQACLNDYPGGLAAIPQGDGRGWFGYKSGAECAAKLAAKTPSRVAGNMIFLACRRLYDPLELTPADFDWPKQK